MRKPVIAGNWKMYKTPADVAPFVRTLAPMVAGSRHAEIVICAPFVDLPAAVEAARQTNIEIGAQDVFWLKEGAYTGEISAPMLREVGVYGTLVAHSERRGWCGETDETAARRCRAALVEGLDVIFCVGETLEEREAGETEAVLRRQVGVLEHDDNLVVAYEPVWAIGTGRTATPETAQEAHELIKSLLDVPVLYGGSVKPENAAELLAQPAVDGALVGGASLDLASFAAICRAASQSS